MCHRERKRALNKTKLLPRESLILSSSHPSHFKLLPFPVLETSACFSRTSPAISSWCSSTPLSCSLLLPNLQLSVWMIWKTQQPVVHVTLFATFCHRSWVFFGLFVCFRPSSWVKFNESKDRVCFNNCKWSTMRLFVSIFSMNSEKDIVWSQSKNSTVLIHKSYIF